MVTSLIVVIISQCIQTLNHYIIPLKLIRCYMSITPQKHKFFFFKCEILTRADRTLCESLPSPLLSYITSSVFPFLCLLFSFSLQTQSHLRASLILWLEHLVPRELCGPLLRLLQVFAHRSPSSWVFPEHALKCLTPDSALLCPSFLLYFFLHSTYHCLMY